MDMFRLNHEQLLKGVNLSFQRYLSRQVKWDRRLIGIFGAKGVGKLCFCCNISNQLMAILMKPVFAAR